MTKRLVHSELQKLRSNRTFWIMTAILTALSVLYVFMQTDTFFKVSAIETEIIGTSIDLVKEGPLCRAAHRDGFRGPRDFSDRNGRESQGEAVPHQGNRILCALFAGIVHLSRGSVPALLLTLGTGNECGGRSLFLAGGFLKARTGFELNQHRLFPGIPLPGCAEKHCRKLGCSAFAGIFSPYSSG